jgi:uncharacterized protein (TIGR03437 family)
LTPETHLFISNSIRPLENPVKNWKLARHTFVLLCVAVSVLHAQPNRIRARIDSSQRATLTGHVHPLASHENDRGRVAPSAPLSDITLAFRPTPDQQADLESLLVAQRTPGSPDYHRWLTPEQYADRFGLSQSDLAGVAGWLQDQGLTVTGVARSRTWVRVSGRAGSVERAFQTELHHYNVNGRGHFANSLLPSVPQQLQSIVRSIRGLNDFRPHARHHPMRNAAVPNAQPDYTSSKGNHYLAPADHAIIYNISPLQSTGYDGTGQTIVVAGQTQINLSDVRQFRSKYGLPAADPQVMLVPGAQDPGVNKDDQDEAHLDIEWSGAIARNATILYVYASDVFDAVQYAIDANLAPVISTSYGNCEGDATAGDAATMQGWAQQGNAQGMTWFAASGDDGAADCAYLGQSGLTVDVPASIPEVTAVGGTEFQEANGQYWNAANTANYSSALSYIPEVVWNDSAIDGQPAATGGGGSKYFTKPSWQVGPGVPGDNVRHVPDIAMNASADHDGYLVYSQGADAVFGGTSVPTPIYAGLTAILNQYLVATGAQSTPGLGNINPTLYSLAQTSPSVFHDITSGDNIVTVPCGRHAVNCTPTPVGYSAGVGYDQTTGLGSVDAAQLFAHWSSSVRVPAISARLVLQSNIPSLGVNDTVFLTATASASDGSTPSGTVTFTEGGTTLGTATLTGNSGVATATLAIQGAKLSQGSGTITAALNGSVTATLAISASGTGGASTPSIAGVTNAGSYATACAPGAILSLFGSQLANATGVAPSTPLPLNLAGVAITVNGIAAPIWYVSPGQINFQMPYEVGAGTNATLVVNNNGRTASTALQVSVAAPGIFTPIVAGTRGDTLTLYLTGAGLVSPEIADGAAPPASTPIVRLPAPEQSTTVTIGGVNAPITFIGNPAGAVGVMQVNFVVPSGISVGTQPVVVTIGGAASPAASLAVTQ